jgi:hypothetical protein
VLVQAAVEKVMERQTKRNAMLQSVLVHKLGLPCGRTMIASGAHESKASARTYSGKFALMDLSDLLPTWSSSDQNVDAQPVVRSLATLYHRCRASPALTQKSAHTAATRRGPSVTLGRLLARRSSTRH